MFLLNGRPDEHTRDAMLDQAARLDSLAADLRRIAIGTSPVPSDLVGAPVLHGWRRGVRPEPCLRGIGAAHPHLPDGPITTSGIWVMDATVGWVRTLGRFYVLGEPEPDAPRPGTDLP